MSKIFRLRPDNYWGCGGQVILAKEPRYYATKPLLSRKEFMVITARVSTSSHSEQRS